MEEEAKKDIEGVEQDIEWEAKHIDPAAEDIDLGEEGLAGDN